MSVILFRKRPVLEHIIEQHAEEAAFLWTQRNAATDAAHFRRRHLTRIDERVEAHVDGLRVAGEAGQRIAQAQLEQRPEKGELFAAAVLALESRDMRRIEPLVGIAEEAEPDVRRGFVGAIGWCAPTILAPTVQSWYCSRDGFKRYLSLCACSLHRADAGPELARHLLDDNPLVRARAFRLVGELGRSDILDACLGNISLDGGDPDFWAAWSSVLLGERESPLQALKTLALSNSPRSGIALELAARAMPLGEGASWVRDVSGLIGFRRAAVVTVGHLGDPAAVPWPIEQMADATLGRVAGEAFAMITGADIVSENLERKMPTADIDPVDLIEDDNLRWPEPGLVKEWWDKAHRGFEPGIRYLLGQPFSDAAWQHALDAGFQRERRAAAYSLALTSRGVLPNWRAR